MVTGMTQPPRWIRAGEQGEQSKQAQTRVS
jgi:hypothetical protein